jgi:2-methylcitrate dehydratase PrpD
VSELTDRLWEPFGRMRADDVPTAAKTVAHQCILDWAACAVAGSVEPLSGILRDEFATSVGACSVVGTDLSVGAREAAMLNGAAGHALDFDDTHTTMGGHPTAPLFPAAVALAQERDASGTELLAAFVAGFEIESRLGAAIGPEHYLKGWHQTSTIGVFGAAAACCHLLGADNVQFGHAMGLAASQSSGLKANFGTMTKPFHAGQAAERGLLSARLAMRGFTSNPSAIEGSQGLAEAAGNGTLDLDRMARYDGRWMIEQTLFKYHAACYLTHAGIEATAALLASGLDVRDVRSVTLTVNPSILKVCGIPRPSTGLEAKFSLTGTQAFTLLGIDTADPAAFDDARVRANDVQSIVARVNIETYPSLRTTQTRSCIETADATYEGAYDTGVPASDLEAQGVKLRAKFDGLVRPILGSTRADDLAGRLHLLAGLPSARDLF